MSRGVLTRDHFRKRGHYFLVHSKEFGIEMFGVAGSLCLEHFHGMTDVLAFLPGNRRKSRTEVAGSLTRNDLVAGNRERFEHYLLRDHAPDQVTYPCVRQKSFTDSFPVRSIQVASNVQSHLLACRAKPRRVTPLAACVNERLGLLGGVIADLRKRFVVHRPDELSCDGLGENVAPYVEFLICGTPVSAQTLQVGIFHDSLLVSFKPMRNLRTEGPRGSFQDALASPGSWRRLKMRR